MQTEAWSKMQEGNFKYETLPPHNFKRETIPGVVFKVKHSPGGVFKCENPPWVVPKWDPSSEWFQKLSGGHGEKLGINIKFLSSLLNVCPESQGRF